MIIDVLLICGAILSIGIGYNKGFISSLLAIIGYFGGGVVGLLISIRYTEGWNSKLSLIGIYILGIFIGASLGRTILQKIGSGIHKRILFGPLKFLDSLLGGALYLVQFSLLAVLILTVVKYLPITFISEQIEQSRAFSYFSGVNPLSFLTSNLLQSISSHLDLPR